MEKFRNISLTLLIILTVIIISLCTYYNYNISKVSEDSTLKTVEIKEGGLRSIGTTLKENNLIRNVTVFMIYAKLNKTSLKAGVYQLSEDMGVKKIAEVLEGGKGGDIGELSITFPEGINMRQIAKLISENTNNSYDSVIEKVEDANYIDTLIDKYWFLTDDIESSDIYYPLEGYLFPNTYRFTNKDVTVEEIFTKMLDEMDRKLSPYQDKIKNSNYSVHEFLTLASIIELEESKKDDRKAVAGVFYNRLNSSSFPTLGSDATTYYASKIDDRAQKLSNEELNDCNNKYNTRCAVNSGIPVGPICNPSIDSIIASINPEEHNYYYFVNDCSGKLYLTTNETEHNNIINKLKREDNWCA